jgi:ubiquinone biosynthesis accessory factor UbiJ
MFNTLGALLTPALVERLTLLANHVLSSEPVATEKLRPHAARVIELRITAWPSLLPAPPVLAWRITPAGLLEACGTDTAPVADLTVMLDAANPAALVARWAAGEAPPVQVQGDAALAGDINWLVQNLRWDVAADLERAFGPTAAQPLIQLGKMLAGGLRSAVTQAGELAQRWRAR